MDIFFSKYQGAGNDFLVIDDRKESFPSNNSSLIERLCHRRFGIGADGLLLLQNSLVSDFRMRIFNADGLEAESCGNGLRCFVRFLVDQKLLSGRASLEVLGGNVLGWMEKEEVYISLDYQPSKTKEFFQKNKSAPIYFLNTGVPHAVSFVENLSTYPILEEGKKLRSDPFFGKPGTNVNFVEKVGEEFQVRTFERGVEDETYACGTGAIAVAMVVQATQKAPNPILLRFKGGLLSVYLGERIILSGSAEKVCEGTFVI